MISSKVFEMFAIERLLSVTYYIRRGGKTICRCAQAAADKGPQEPKAGHIEKKSVEENP
jgi:hypothetical protein